MNFNKHSNLVGAHAFLSASQSAWLRYSDEKFIERYRSANAAKEGTEIHDIAAKLIEKKIELPDNGLNICNYVNDGIRFKMKPETVLFYSPNAFATADTISFSKNLLRIHDLKTGHSERVKIEDHEDQLKVYAAYFCLEYEVNPCDIQMELRIYKNDEVHIFSPDPDEILDIMEKIVHFDKIIQDLKNGEE